MAEGARQAGYDRETGPVVQIGAAHARCLDPDQHLIGARFRARHRVIDEAPAGSCEPHGVHRATLGDSFNRAPQPAEEDIRTFQGRRVDRESYELELKRLQSERDVAQRLADARSDLVAHVSHDMRAPLNGILGMAQLLLEDDLEPHQREYAELISSSGEALLTLVNDLLDHSKIEAGKLAIDAVPFDLAHTIRDTVRSLELVARDKGLALGMEAGSDLPQTVVGDPGRIRQILYNLIGNAIKFTHDGGVTVTVVTEKVAEGDLTLRFGVVDTGVGMTTEQTEAVFQPFEQADAEVFKHYGGTGLGLAISRRLAGMMGGKMWAESTPEVGSTFWFTVEVGTEIPSQTTDSGLPASRDELEVVLITDTRRPSVVRGLDGTRLRVIHVTSSAQAPDVVSPAIAERPAHIVVMDFREEGLHGPAGAIPAIGDAKVIVLTPAGQRGDAARCRQLGVGAYLTGSVTGRDVSRAVDALVEGVPALITRHWLREQGSYR